MTTLTVSAGFLQVRIEPQLAGRVVSLTFQGEELLVGPEVNPTNFGSTYWTSPQADWGWPPVPAIDHAPFEVVAQEPVQLRGPVASFDDKRLRLEKSFRADPERACLVIEYCLENCDERAVRVAGWEISRVPPGGLTLYPTGQAELSPVPPHAQLPLMYEQGYSLYDHAGFSVGQNLKVHADAARGLLVHLTAPSSAGKRFAFFKLFQDSTPEQQAPGEGEVEIFANEDGRYVEIEVQGAYQTLTPGEKRSFCVTWAVREVPPYKTQEELFAWIQQVEQEVRQPSDQAENNA